MPTSSEVESRDLSVHYIVELWPSRLRLNPLSMRGVFCDCIKVTSYPLKAALHLCAEKETLSSFSQLSAYARIILYVGQQIVARARNYGR